MILLEIWILIIASSFIMAKVAASEGKPELLWGALTFLICLGSGFLIPLPLINVGIGLVLSFVAFTIAKIVR